MSTCKTFAHLMQMSTLLHLTNMCFTWLDVTLFLIFLLLLHVPSPLRRLAIVMEVAAFKRFPTYSPLNCQVGNDGLLASDAKNVTDFSHFPCILVLDSFQFSLVFIAIPSIFSFFLSLIDCHVFSRFTHTLLLLIFL